MKRWIGLSLCTILSLQAATIGELFEALRKQPQTRLDAMQAEYTELSAQKVTDSFYPAASLFASFEHYNAPTNLRPVSPVENVRLGKEGKPLPFATTIERIGAKVTMPIFVKELFSLVDKANARAKSAKARKRLNFLKNEAVLLGSNARWRYLESLEKAMHARKRSIEKMAEDMRVSVESGRAPGVMLDKLEESVNRLEMGINAIEIKKTQLKSRIEALTGMTLERPASLAQKREVTGAEFFAAKPVEYAIEASEHALQASGDALYPKVTASAYWSENYGQGAVGTQSDAGDDVHRGYGNYMVAVSMPLYEKGRYTAIEQAKVELARERLRLAKTKQELDAESKALKRSLTLYGRSEDLARKSVGNRTRLLAYAKVAFDAGRMTEEEYLRYEEALLDAQSRVYEAAAKRWESVAQLAVIYGNDLSDIVE